MNILEKMQNVENSYESYRQSIIEREEAKKKLDVEIAQISDEMKKLQGAFITLRELGIESGVLDAEGKPVEVAAEAPAPASAKSKK